MGAQLLMAEERLAQNQSTEVVDAFRLFISGKQYFKEMIINDPYLLSDSKTKVNRYYRIGWQSNTWFIEEIEPSNDERTSWQRKVNLYGVAFDKVWSVGNLAVTFADRDDKRLWAGVSTNSIENTVGFREHGLYLCSSLVVYYGFHLTQSSGRILQGLARNAGRHRATSDA